MKLSQQTPLSELDPYFTSKTLPLNVFFVYLQTLKTVQYSALTQLPYVLNVFCLTIHVMKQFILSRLTFELIEIKCVPCSSSAIWAELRECFPEARINGCGFHWVQCIRKKWSKLGLFNHQHKDLTIYLHRVWAMRFVPSDRIVKTFTMMKQHALQHLAATHTIHQFFLYVESQWIESTCHPPSSWCQYGLQVRTNNAMEGWHRAFNRRMGARPALYTFISKLAFDADSVSDIITNGDFFVKKNKDQTAVEEKISIATEKCRSGEIKMSNFLDEICNIFKYGQVRNKSNK